MLVKWLLFMILLELLLTITKGQEPQWNLMRQSDYLVKIHRLEPIWYNHSYLNDLKADYSLYNRTQRAFNGGARLLVHIEKGLRLDVQLYKMMSNEYRFFPVTVSLDMCKEVERNSFGARTEILKTTNITGCPIKKGYYYCRNAVVDYSKFPPFIPHGDYKIELKVYHEANYLGEGDVYFKVFGKPLLPI